MKHTVKLFEIGLRQITKDGMLLMLVTAPFLVGIFLKFTVPYLNHLLTDRLSFSITAWYALSDGMLICLSPMFTAIASSFLLLDEKDEGLGAFYQITPAAGYSYLFARVGLPMIWAFIVTIIISISFNISSLSFGVILSCSLLSCFTGIFLAMMVVSIAGNRVEGLAVSKLMGISFIGLILIWFIPAPYHFIMAFLPSFWIGKLLMDGAGFASFLSGLLTCCLWIIIFTGKFLKRV